MGIVVGILGLAALIVIHEAGHFLAARLFGMRVLRFSVGFFKPIFQWKPRGSETTYSVGILPLGGYVQVDGLSPVDEVDPEDKRSYANQPIYAKLAMIVAGPLANFLTAALFLAVLFVAGFPMPTEEAIIGTLRSGQPAAEAGLQSGDRILKIGGQSVTTWNEMREQIQGNKGKAVVVEFRRGDEEREVTVTPAADTGQIGITPATQMADPIGPIEALGKGFYIAGGMTAGLAVGVWHMVTGQSSTAGVAGPPGIVQMIADAVSVGWRSFVWMLVQLSISLCLLNFLPIPALDGGRVVFLAVEGITRRRVNRTVEGYIHVVGLFLILGLVLLVSVRDVLHWF